MTNLAMPYHSAGVQHVLPSAAVWQLARQRPQEPAEALNIVRDARHSGAAATDLSTAQAQEVRKLTTHCTLS